MLGAIIGDVVGSIYEFNNIKTKKFNLFSKDSTFTDDTVMTIAVAKTLLESDSNNISNNIVTNMQLYGRKYHGRGYGGAFRQWLYSEFPEPYNSYGNGSAMRISPVGFFARSEEEVKSLSCKITEVTHNHPEGIKGAEAVALSIYKLRNGLSKNKLKEYISSTYYNLDSTLNEIRRNNSFNETCQVTVPQAFEAFFESSSFEDTIRNAISIGGDSDTIAAIAGSIAEAYYGVPDDIKRNVRLKFLPVEFRDIISEFYIQCKK